MVTPEQYKYTRNKKAAKAGVKAGIFAQIASKDCEVLELARKANGAWYATVRVTLRFELGDERVVTVDRPLRLRGIQEGKRPNPNAFGRGKKSR